MSEESKPAVPSRAEIKLDTVLSQPQGSRLSSKLARLRGPIAAIAAVGAILGGFVGYWNTYRTVRESVASPAVQAASVQPTFSVAVMPFVAATGSADEEKLAGALTDNLRSMMGKSRVLRVAAPGKVLESKGKSNDPQTIGRALNVRYIVDGSVRMVESQATITFQLTDAESGLQVLSDRLTTSEITSTEHHVSAAAKIREIMVTALFDKEVQRVAAKPTRSAVDLWAMGRRELNAAYNAARLADEPARTMRLTAARKYYDDALRIDPNFVPALDDLAAILRALVPNDLDSDSATRTRRIDELDRITSRAVALDEGYMNAWYERAEALTWLERFDQGLEANAKARALEPSSTSANTDQQAELLLRLNRPEEALVVSERASAMVHEKGSGQEGYSHQMICVTNLLLGRYEVAVAACEKAAANDDYWGDQMYLTAGYAQLGDAAKAAGAKAVLLAKKPTFTIEKYKAVDPGTLGYHERAEAHLYAGLRKAGIPER